MQERFVTDERRAELLDLLDCIEKLREKILREAPRLLLDWGAPSDAASLSPGLANLAHYVILRRQDLRDLQSRLAAFGLSSLGRSEAKVLTALDALLATLQRLCGKRGSPYPPAVAMRAGEMALSAEADRIFAGRKAGPQTYVMATLPPQAAEEAGFVEKLMRAGMHCARINCAHDDAAAWSRMISNIRCAEARVGRSCKILMDLAGPKCRVALVRAPDKFRLYRGDRFNLAATLDNAGGAVAITATLPQAISQLAIGAEVWINDGKIGARVIGRSDGEAQLEVFSAREKGERLKPEKGVNFPTTELDLSPLTKKDFVDLDFIAQHADMVGFSFVQRSSDIELLQDHLAARRGDRPVQAIVLKIETALAVRNLPQLIVRSALHNPTAVMIARGDLAVELTFARLSEIQEEILWLCEAAHVPVVWATQVLDQFVKEGVPSRSETTDAAMAQRADCVMLNKGPYLAEGLAFLENILSRMDRHHAKKFARLAPLHAW